MEDVYWQGEKLPPLREGYVWGFWIYPGGRTEVRQCKSHNLSSPFFAVRELMDGHATQVWLDDATTTLALWKLAE